MSKQVNQLLAKIARADLALRKAAQYVADVQPKIDANNELFDKFIKRAHQSVGGLVGRGFVPQRKSNDLIDKIASDITTVFDVIDKMAELASATPSLGKRSDMLAASDRSDPFVRLVLTGDCNGQIISNGMVD